MEVSIGQSGDNSRTYTFDTPIRESQLQWLDQNRNVESFEVTEKTLTVNSTGTVPFDELERDFIMPGLKRTFGQNLNIKHYSHSK